MDRGYSIFTSANPSSHWYRVSFVFQDVNTIKLSKANVSSSLWKTPHIYKVTGIKLGGGSSSSEENYSTEEQRIGNWIDGKPLYQKTITGYNVGSTSTNGIGANVEIPASDLNVDSVVDLSAIIKASNGMLPLPAFWGTGSYGVQVYYKTANNTILVKNTSTDYNGADVAVTIKYTKTTD